MEDSRGQVSIEFILVVGAILTMTLVGIPMILRNAEMNKALAAARDGATYAAAMRGLGFNYKGGNPPGVVKIINITPEYQHKVGGLHWYRLRIYVKAPDALIDNPVCSWSSVGMSIRRQSTSYLKYAFQGDWSDKLERINGSYYSFTTACDFV